jgi:hypothetical protein
LIPIVAGDKLSANDLVQITDDVLFANDVAPSKDRTDLTGR